MPAGEARDEAEKAEGPHKPCGGAEAEHVAGVADSVEGAQRDVCAIGYEAEACEEAQGLAGAGKWEREGEPHDCGEQYAGERAGPDSDHRGGVGGDVGAGERPVRQLEMGDRAAGGEGSNHMTQLMDGHHRPPREKACDNKGRKLVKHWILNVRCRMLHGGFERRICVHQSIQS